MTATTERTPERAESLSRTAGGEPVPTASERARRTSLLTDRFAGWFWSLSIALMALALRLWHLSAPKVFEFDETWYAKDAFSLLRFGYARDYVEDADKLILDGQRTDLWTGSPSMAVHPDVGKWMIALGEKAFGLDPSGWRISAAITGSLMVLVMCRFVRRITGSTLLGCLGGLLLALDGLHLVLSRLGLLDIFLAFWLLCAVHCVVADRDWFRRRLADRADLDEQGRATGWGPLRGTVLRPWLLLGGICFGLAVGTKWGALYPLAVFGVLAFAWSAGARRSFGVRWPWLKALVADAPIAFVHLVVIGGLVYTASWTGWLMHADAYEEHLSYNSYTQARGAEKWPTAKEADADGLGEVSQSLRSLWHYHRDVYEFHTNGLEGADHPYKSKPSGWLLLNRPVGVDAQNDIQPGDQGCDAEAGSTCMRQVLLLGNPLIWWAGCAALIFGLLAWLGGRDWRWSVVIGGVASTWLPWLQYDDRPIFLFYAIATLPFLVLGLTLTLGRILGAETVPSGRRTAGVIVVGSYVVLTVIAFVFYWPIWTDVLITYDEWIQRMWFKRWI